MGSESAATSNSNIYSKIKNLMELNHKLTMGFMTLHEDLIVNADEEKRNRANTVLLEDFGCLEKEMAYAVIRLESLRMQLNNATPVISEVISTSLDNNPPSTSTENLLEPSVEEPKGCGDICCTEVDLKTSAGLKLFCGENMRASQWVHHVDQVARGEKWNPRHTYVLAFKAMRGKARKVALRLMEKRILYIPLACGEPDSYPDGSIETTAYWERKLTDDQVINQSLTTLDHAVNSQLPKSHNHNWDVLREILLCSQDTRVLSRSDVPFIGFEALVKLEKLD